MPVITLDQARAHLRVGATYPQEQIGPYMAGAEDHASQYLNRVIYADSDAMNTAIEALPASLTAARVAYEEAIAAAALIENASDRRDAVHIAESLLRAARAGTARALNGIVVNPSIISAVLLILGHLFESREDVVIAATAVELPHGARALLRPYRRVMMP
ncbi:head-tail connector protein [Variovorax sp. R-27]|uniref:head-tail connector protein n=1 Tax=Variovorax sp. R-27 TaxID=3404058 RepID=UPI003CF180F9